MQFISRFFAPSLRRRALDVACVAAVAVWVVWWFDALKTFRLRGVPLFWFRVPGMGADFWTESELFARTWAAGGDPYLNEVRLFHYPPLVLRLFSWVAYFEPFTALRIWVLVLGIIVVASTIVAARSRRALGIPELSALHALPLVLFSTAVLFEMERANWDFISFVPIMLALPLLKPGRAPLDFVAGCLLAVCPWVKIYPGLIGIALLALRRWYAVAGFGAACVGLLAAMFRESMSSLHIIKLAMDMVRQLGWFGGDYPPWVHSLSMAWLRILYLTVGKTRGERILGYTAWAWALVVVLPLLGWVGMRIFRSKGADRLVYPWLLWTVAVASFVPDIANDYSLAFLPVAAVAASSFRDPPWVRVGLVLLALWWQPFALRIPGSVMLAIKLVGVIAVGGSIVTRARELDVRTAKLQNVPPSPM